jgi:hypothetical protein
MDTNNYRPKSFSPAKFEQLAKKFIMESNKDREKLEKVYEMLVDRVENQTDHDKYSDYMRGLLDVLGKLITSRDPLVKSLATLGKLSHELKKTEKAASDTKNTYDASYESLQQLLNETK